MAVKSYIIGISGALIFLGIVYSLFFNYAREIFALFLALTAAVYSGCALTEEGKHFGLIELLATAVTFFLAALGLFLSPLFLSLGYLLHGIWDALHHSKKIATPVSSWFSPACLIFDVILAFSIFIHWTIIS